MKPYEDAQELCIKLYRVLSEKGYYPALTGGSLYKKGPRKDIDIVIYRNRQMHVHFELVGIENYLVEAGIHNVKHYGFVSKGKYGALSVDLLNPESSNKEYDIDEIRRI
jgi:hypothetical protein